MDGSQHCVPSCSRPEPRSSAATESPYAEPKYAHRSSECRRARMEDAPQPRAAGIGLVVGGLGFANLLPKARRPKPILLSDTAVGWLFGGERQWAGWDEVAGVEPWWTPIGFGRIRPTANHILLRGRDGEPVTALRVGLLAVDPELALRAIREAHAAASAHAATEGR